MGGITTKLGFVIFYVTFLSFVVYLSGLAGGQILKNVPEFSGLPEPNVVNVFVTVEWFFALLSVSTEYQILFALVFAPLSIGFLWCLLELIRGV